jgi:hypothetical protein
VLCSIRAWVIAIRGLRENPLNIYWRQAEKRRRRAPLERLLNLITPWAVVGYTVLALIRDLSFQLLCAVTPPERLMPSSGENPLAWPAPWGQLDHLLLLAVIALKYVVLPVYIVWALLGVAETVGLAAQVLSAPDSKRIHHLKLDEALAVTPLSARECVAGMLGALLPPLLLRVVIGAALILALKSMVSLFVVLSVIAIVISSSLAATAVLLYMITLGRGLRLEAHAGAVGWFTAISQLICWGLAYSTMDLLPQPSARLGGWWIAAGMLLALLTLYFALFLAQRSIALRRVLAAGSPLLAVALLVLWLGSNEGWVASTVLGSSGKLNSWWCPIYSYCFTWGGFLMLNPLAVPLREWLWCADETRFKDAAPWLLYTGWRLPMLLLLQVVVCAILAEAARLAVAARCLSLPEVRKR